MKLHSRISWDVSRTFNDSIMKQHRKDTEAPVDRIRARPACFCQCRQMAVERQNKGMRQKRSFPGGCLASSTILPKPDEEMKWAAPPLCPIRLIPSKMLSFRTQESGDNGGFILLEWRGSGSRVGCFVMLFSPSLLVVCCLPVPPSCSSFLLFHLLLSEFTVWLESRHVEMTGSQG